MHGFSRRPIALFACALFSGLPWAYAENGPLSRVDADPALGVVVPAPDLRVERRFEQPVAKVRPASSAPIALPSRPGIEDEDTPLLITAEQISGQTDVRTEAEGAVELRKPGQVIFADRVTYRPMEDEVEASGHVRMTRDGEEVATPYLRMKLSDQLGFTEQASYSIAREVKSRFYQPNMTQVTVSSVNGANSGAPMMLNVPNSYGLPTTQPETRFSAASGTAERIDFLGENQMQLTGATYSTCKPATPDWYLKTAEMNLDYDNSEGDAKHASLWFKGVPLFYSPVAWFPLSQQRRSGVLSPSFTQSTRNGLDVKVPFYWNIAPNYDATFFPRYLGKRGMQLGMEGRYLGTASLGETRFEYMPEDRVTGNRRYAYGVRHQQWLGAGVSGYLDWNGVSDDYYWQDMSSRLMQTSQTQLPRHAALNYAPSSWLQTSLQVLRYQTLQPDPANPVDRPYFLEPQLNLVGYRPNLWKSDLSMIGQYSRFTHPTKVNGERVLFYPQFSFPILHPAYRITPKIGVHSTYYSLGDQLGNSVSTLSRTLPILSLDSTMIFEREGEWLGKGYIQTLEPRLYYVNIPYRDQSRVPVFDSGLADFNFAQIFSENRYSGYDRINDANQLTAAVTSRFLDGQTGVELFKATLGQRYYFKPQRVTLPGESLRQADFSNLVAAVNGLVAPKTYAEAAWEYNYKEGMNQRFSAGARFQPDYGKVLSASYRYTRDPLTGASTIDQLDFAGQWPLVSRWYAVGRYNYSLRDSRLLEAIGGLEYNAGCWTVRGVVQRLGAITGAPNNTLFLQLELTDFASLGSNPLGLLRRSIPGYGKTNELPTDSSLLNLP